MMKHKFYIVRSVRLKVDHCLLANPGTKIQDLREVYSHDQALSQCAGYLKALGVKVVACENTAEAARLVAESGRTDVAAIASRSCAALYRLELSLIHILDPSHGTGRASLVPPMALAATAAGADGLIIEVHNDPAHALCDGAQSLTPEQFQKLSADVQRVREALA